MLTPFHFSAVPLETGPCVNLTVYFQMNSRRRSNDRDRSSRRRRSRSDSRRRRNNNNDRNDRRAVPQGAPAPQPEQEGQSPLLRPDADAVNPQGAALASGAPMPTLDLQTLRNLERVIPTLIQMAQADSSNRGADLSGSDLNSGNRRSSNVS